MPIKPVDLSDIMGGRIFGVMGTLEPSGYGQMTFWVHLPDGRDIELTTSKVVTRVLIPRQSRGKDTDNA